MITTTEEYVADQWERAADTRFRNRTDRHVAVLERLPNSLCSGTRPFHTTYDLVAFAGEVALYKRFWGSMHSILGSMMPGGRWVVRLPDGTELGYDSETAPTIGQAEGDLGREYNALLPEGTPRRWEWVDEYAVDKSV